LRQPAVSLTQRTSIGDLANFWNNPQYEFTVTQKSDGSAASTVVVSVMQRTNRFSDNQQIGFYLFQVCF